MRLRRALVLISALTFGTVVLGQDVPRKMTYQGRLARNDGTPETAPQDLKFAIYAQPTGGAPLWEETQTQVALSNGYYAVVLGKSAPLPASVFNGQDLYLGLTVAGGAELAPRIQVASVPYALKAGDARALEGKTAADFALVSHSHPNATSGASGFMSAGDKQRFDAIPYDLAGNGLSQSGTGAGSTLNVDYSQVAAKTHSHGLVCKYRTASGSESGGVTAFCSAGESLMGGGCEDLDSPNPNGGTLQMDHTSKPVGVTSDPNGDAGIGHLCQSSANDTVTAWAYCCRVQ